MSGSDNSSRERSAKADKPSRSERLALQLRANLKKRKAVTRAQREAETPGAPPARAADGNDEV